MLRLRAGRRRRIKRSPAARRAFQREHPCPRPAHRRGACPGYVVDYVVPLRRGGPDDSVRCNRRALRSRGPRIGSTTLSPRELEPIDLSRACDAFIQTHCPPDTPLERWPLGQRSENRSTKLTVERSSTVIQNSFSPALPCPTGSCFFS